MNLGIDGIVATNTTIKRPIPINTQSRKAFSNDGGLSGRPLQSRSLEVISKSYSETDGKIPIIGVGGIDSAESAWEAITSVPHYCNCIRNGIRRSFSCIQYSKGIKEESQRSGFYNYQRSSWVQTHLEVYCVIVSWQGLGELVLRSCFYLLLPRSH